ncbi:MAG TPA: HAMP domain-containing protein [Phycisphaerales bacterium]|nr:HAMP domain-containing protein [Phycisphaerales bacterium]
MLVTLNRIWLRTLRLVGLWPLSLARKCRITFGIAVSLTLVLALLPPYIWMGQLMTKDYIDTERGKAEALVFRNHFQLKSTGETPLAPLDAGGALMDVNNPEIRWVRLHPENTVAAALEALPEDQRQLLEDLRQEESRDERFAMERAGDIHKSLYARIFRAGDNCLSCHSPQGLAAPFTRDQVIGAIVIQRHIVDLDRTIFLNRVWIVFAGLIAGTGAVVAFYWITQRVILRPIRQLRAMANNVAEGNLDTRSSIKTADEYEKLARSFNHMLDNLQATQKRLRQANVELDEKIAELSERNIALIKANKTKDEFLANISHEFRTPLNAILGFAQVLREKPAALKKEKGQKYAENIITSGNRLLAMINDLLDLARSQAGKMELHIEETTVETLFHRLITSFSLLTREKKIKVKTTIAPDVPVLITDAGKVQQILHNFLSNAVKFTPVAGRVEIAAVMVGEKTVRISVADNGCGIAPEDQHRIFEKFQQVDGSITRASAGSGLGLAISRELASILAGDVGLQSQLGQGATFWLDIPTTLATDPSL